MALQKQTVNLNFSQGLETKSDPYQQELGQFQELSNAVFDTPKRLTKANGFKLLPALPDNSSTYLTTFNGNLTAIGSKFEALAGGTNSWVNKGAIQPLSLSTLPVVRSSTNQSAADTVIASNGLAMTVFADNIPNGGSNSLVYKYVITDSATGQAVVNPTLIVPNAGTVTYSPRVALLGSYFVIVFTTIVTSTPHIQFIAVPVNNPFSSSTVQDITVAYTATSTLSFDIVPANGNLYIAYAGASAGGVKLTYIDSTLTLHSTVTFSNRVATHMSLTADLSGPTAVIWAGFYNSGDQSGYALAVNQNLQTVLAPTQIISGQGCANVTVVATNQSCSFLYEVSQNLYGYPANYVLMSTISQAGVVSAAKTLQRSVGLASKAFFCQGTAYVVLAFGSTFQPTYFVSDFSGNLILKLAYSNGGGYLSTGLPQVNVSGSSFQFCYLVKDLIQSVNKNQGIASANGIYSQTGVNLATVTLGTANLQCAEIGNNLNLTGGFVWAYDGVQPVEQNFHVWPELTSAAATSSTTGGFLSAQQYYYVALYEWSDNQGNVFRSAPSIPILVDLHASSTATNSVTWNVPTLRLTAKISSPVRLVLYRWSTAQQNYYSTTTVLSPNLNSTLVDTIQIVDTLADSSISGNELLYTTGGVVEDIAPPAANAFAIFDDRVWLIDAEDPNLLWYSKQVIEATPVEFSDLLTMYIPPTTSSEGSTGVSNCIFPMDDKLIVFKNNAIYYINGTGPDNTGSQSAYSQATFITSTVGCSSLNSIVMINQGLMFKSEKGIWLLGRDLSTNYIGAPVELYNAQNVLSAVSVPNTNQVRFTLDSGVILYFDYFANQWSVREGLNAISSTVFQGFHTLITPQGKAYQESPGQYLDGSTPVLLNFTTGWINAAGLQGFERIYDLYLLGTFVSPCKLVVGIAYDYNPSIQQVVTISPNNYSGSFGSDPIFGGSASFGGKSNVMPWRVHMQRQKCEAFQISIQEIYDPSFGVQAGGGFTLSGINMTIGIKGTRPKLAASNQVG